MTAEQPNPKLTDLSWWDRYCVIQRGTDKGKPKGFVRPSEALKMSDENRRRCCA